MEQSDLDSYCFNMQIKINVDKVNDTSQLRLELKTNIHVR